MLTDLGNEEQKVKSLLNTVNTAVTTASKGIYNLSVLGLHCNYVLTSTARLVDNARYG